jgi:hypothetical protein
MPILHAVAALREAMDRLRDARPPDAQHQPQKFMRESMSSRTRSCAINSHREARARQGLSNIRALFAADGPCHSQGAKTQPFNSQERAIASSLMRGP